ncbi:MAG TPA: zf-HC2 domain-containing protein, partial [Acidimicrobiales bacterium]|nr:zf-HC2 domain-containing protein [Acidimicrobiales bacterium]
MGDLYGAPEDIHPDEELSALLDGELDFDSEASVRRHLAFCTDCTEELDRLAGARHALRRLDPVDPPPGLAERFGKRLRRILRIFAVVAAAGGAAVGAGLWAASPERAVHPPIDEVDAYLPTLPVGEALPSGRAPDGWSAPGALDGMQRVAVRQVGAMTAAVYGSGSDEVMLL